MNYYPLSAPCLSLVCMHSRVKNKVIMLSISLSLSSLSLSLYIYLSNPNNCEVSTSYLHYINVAAEDIWNIFMEFSICHNS